MLLEVGGYPRELHGDGVAADFEQFCAGCEGLFSDPTKDPELIGSTAGE